MSHADDIRDYCARHYIVPARERGEQTVTIRSGDVHEALGYRNRFPAVCGAIGAGIFEEQCRIRRVSIEGPTNGANTLYRFEILS